MIFVKRNKQNLDFVDKPKDFKDKVKEEFEKAKKHYIDGDKSVKPDFSQYKNSVIKAELISMFGGKCAYCDSRLVHITSGDIEHFRPKSKYWWLAAEWNNLLFACEKCNRTGKNDAFPLDDESIQIAYYDEEALKNEDANNRLLINPCVENPEDFFEYQYDETEEEGKGVIKVKKNIESDIKKKKMAETSIEVYKLQRPELVHEREKVLLLLLIQVEYTKKAVERYQNAKKIPLSISEKFLPKFEDNLNKELEKLLEFNLPKRSYLGMVRQVLRGFYYDYDLPLPKSLTQIT